MISNERTWPSHLRRNPQPHYDHPKPWQPRPVVQEDVLKSGEVQIERKLFQFALKENPRGRLLRITEDVGGRYNAIIIPAPGLADFQKTFEAMMQAASEIPPPPPAPQASAAGRE